MNGWGAQIMKDREKWDIWKTDKAFTQKMTLQRSPNQTTYRPRMAFILAERAQEC